MTAGGPGAERRELVRAEELVYGLGATRIIDSLSLSVTSGEFVGVIGPNGAGKTTLLRLLLGILRPGSGRVLLSGTPVAELPPRQRARRVAYMSQDAGPAGGFPVQDVLLMGRYPFLGRLGRQGEEDLERARSALAYVGLSGLEERAFDALSGGERQLVLFARVLVQDTDLLLLDEPSSNLDIRHQDQIFSMAAELSWEKRGIVACVHNLNVAARYCSRLVLLDRGRVAADGRPAEVLRPELLEPVYRVRTAVAASPVTGTLVVSVLPRAAAGAGPRIHLISGAGAAVNLTRELCRLGFRVSGGIAHGYDSDQKLWQSLELPHRAVEPFSHIRRQDVEEASSLVREADLTVLCPFPVGAGNVENLVLAARARRLVVLERGPEDPPRAFFSEAGQRLFRELAAAPLMSRTELLSALERGELPG